MIQVASRTLDIPTELIHISETATDKVPNASPTAASVSSDINGMAVLVSVCLGVCGRRGMKFQGSKGFQKNINVHLK